MHIIFNNVLLSCVVVATRSLEALTRCHLALNIPWGSDEYTYNSIRIKQVVAEGVDVRSPEALLLLAGAEILADLETVYKYSGVTYFNFCDLPLSIVAGFYCQRGEQSAGR